MYQIMYPVLFEEMERQHLSGRKLLEIAGLSYSTVWPKIRNGKDMKINEAAAIRNALDIDIPLEVLFKRAVVA